MRALLLIAAASTAACANLSPVPPTTRLENECTDPSNTWSPYHAGAGVQLQRGRLTDCPIIPVIILRWTYDLVLDASR